MSKTLLVRLLVGAALASLATTVLVVPADAKKKKCKAYKEKKGCKLKKGGYNAPVKPSPGQSAVVSVYLNPKLFTVSVSGRRSSPPSQGSSCGPADVTINKAPKVGKSYKLAGSRFTPFGRHTFDGKIKFNSRKKATVTGTVKAADKQSGAAYCTFELKATMKRYKSG